MPKPIPILDSGGGLILGGLFLFLLFLQWKWPLRRQHFSVLRRIARNLFFSAPGLALARISLVPIPIVASVWASNHGIGLLHWLPGLPPLVAVPLGVLLMDYAYWVACGAAPHPVPLALPQCASLRPRYGCEHRDSFSSRRGDLFRALPRHCVIVFGIDLWALVVFEMLFETANFFEHSNWRLPLPLERFLNLILVTPRMHGIHHSIVQRETNSNWGTIFSWWDSLHRTLRRDIPQDAITIGVAAYRDENELTFGRLFVLPFRAPRPWQLPDGNIPERDARPASELAP